MLTKLKMEQEEAQVPLPGRLLPQREYKVWEQVYNQVTPQARAQVTPQVFAQVRAHTWWQFKDAISEPVRDQVFNQVYWSFPPESP